MADLITSSTTSLSAVTTGAEDQLDRRPVRSSASGPGRWVNSPKKRKAAASKKKLPAPLSKSSAAPSITNTSTAVTVDSEAVPPVDLVSDTGSLVEAPPKKKSKVNKGASQGKNKGVCAPVHYVSILY